MFPSGSLVVPPITRLAQVRPPLNVTFTARPETTSGNVDIVTTFDVFVGLTAIASSASLPGIALVSKTDGSGAAAASPVVASAAASARTIIGHLDRNRRLRMRHPFPRDSLVSVNRPLSAVNAARRGGAFWALDNHSVR